MLCFLPEILNTKRDTKHSCISGKYFSSIIIKDGFLINHIANMKRKLRGAVSIFGIKISTFLK